RNRGRIVRLRQRQRQRQRRQRQRQRQRTRDLGHHISSDRTRPVAMRVPYPARRKVCNGGRISSG
ncbi:hypothetical protein, partial [uncultured Thiodictyon sp.]|uniref:hypothetical protein n=1 Tax=uncultured Thiodictyon sp. TaxID=1846217 RepID=UPI0025D42037